MILALIRIRSKRKKKRLKRRRRLNENAASCVIFFLSAALNVNADSLQPCRQLVPVEESVVDSSFVRFRDRLDQAIQTQDSTFLFAVLDEEIKVCFAPDCVGKAAFRSEHYQRREQSFWKELSEMLSLGCVRDAEPEAFSCPYVFRKFPEDLDALDFVVVTASNVPVYGDTLSATRPLATVSYCLVPDDRHRSARWFELELTPRGQKTFVERKYLRSPGDTRIGFRKKQGQWLVVFYVAGD